jgi:hypothetical protein
MKTSRRTFLKTVAVAGAAAALPPSVRAEMTKDGLFPAGPNFHTAPGASVMISGGTITKDGKLTDAVRAAHRLHYGAEKYPADPACDRAGPAGRRRAETAGAFAEDHFTVESLHHWVGAAALQKIAEAEAFFVSGGETFLLLRTLIREWPARGSCASGCWRACPTTARARARTSPGPNIGCTNDFPVVDVPTLQVAGVVSRRDQPASPARDRRRLRRPREQDPGLLPAESRGDGAGHRQRRGGAAACRAGDGRAWARFFIITAPKPAS